jgi:Exo-beta-D-glucosaminidase Ig-fold domain/Glycosyl hydrolases family 2, TIM barrel domain
VGQSTGEDFYELCDKYGILIWDEFFQPNPSDGPNPDDVDTYMANVRDKILRFRNHPAIAIWCARNEGFPPKEIDDKLRTLLAELEPTRLYQASSTDGGGVMSHGPYHWRTPQDFYVFDEPFKTEIGSMSVPTIESIQGMMPQKDWETINDDWAAHDFAKGAAEGDKYRGIIEDRYGKIANLADFVRKSQLANYEAFRAMYEGRNAKLFHPSTAIITWMSHPAQPSFVWQLYHYDLEPNSALFAVKKAGEMVHIQLNEGNGDVEVINNLPTALEGAHAHLALYNLDGSVQYQHDYAVSALPSLATDLGHVDWPATLSKVHFVKLELRDSGGKMLSDNFYWRALPEHKDDLQALGTLATVTLDASAVRTDADGKTSVSVTLHNPGTTVALMTHLQLHRKSSGERVLPVFYSDNYVSLLPGESKTVTVEADTAELKGEQPLVLVDGWNVAVTPSTTAGVSIMVNTNAQVDHWPVTGLPMAAPAE